MDENEVVIAQKTRCRPSEGHLHIILYYPFMDHCSVWNATITMRSISFTAYLSLQRERQLRPMLDDCMLADWLVCMVTGTSYCGACPDAPGCLEGTVRKLSYYDSWSRSSIGISDFFPREALTSYEAFPARV